MFIPDSRVGLKVLVNLFSKCPQVRSCYHATNHCTEGDYLIAYPINTHINLAPRLANTWHKSYATLLSHMPLTNCSLDLSSREPFTYVNLTKMQWWIFQFGINIFKWRSLIIWKCTLYHNIIYRWFQNYLINCDDLKGKI